MDAMLPNPRKSGAPPGQWVTAALGLLPAALACFLALSLAAAAVVPVYKAFPGKEAAGWWAGVLYLLCTGLAAWGVKRAGGWPEGRVAAMLVAVGVALQTLVVFLFPRLPANIDQSLFRHFATRLASGGFNETTLSSLSAFYDYPLWTARAFPVHFLLERLGGIHALAWLKALNIAAATAIACLTYALARRVLPPGKRKWAVFLLVALPFHSFRVADYSHHLFSSLYLLSFAWAASELAFGGGGTLRRILLSLLATACMVLMAWQGGVDLIAAGLAAALVAACALTRGGFRKSLSLALFLLVVPLAGRAALKGPLLADRIAACDAHRWNSVLPAFLARGWCPESGGEYCPRYERLDRATPWPEKPRAMVRLVLSHMRHQPFETCFLLPLVKTAKLFLVGYASNLEESLALADSPALPPVNWIRRFGTLLFLLCAVLGSARLAGAERVPVAWMPVLLLPLLTWGAYVLAGETSPRYSVFCQPLLAVVGACAFGGGPDGNISRRALGSRTATVALVLLASAGAAACAVRALPARIFYEDLRTGRLATATRPGTGHPVFERTLVLPPGGQSAEMLWPVPAGAESGSFYAIGFDGAATGAELVVSTQDGPPILSGPLGHREMPVYERLAFPADTRVLHVTVSRPADTAGLEGTFTFGYLHWGVP